MRNSRIRVAILADFPVGAISGSATGRGGGQGCTWLPQLAAAFERYKDFDIHWVTFQRGTMKRGKVEYLGQTFHLVPAAPYTVDLASDYLPARLLLGNALKRIAPDIVHAWGTERIYPVALAGFDGPTILSMQGILSEYQRIGGLGEGWRWRKMLRSETDFIRSATVVTSESQWGIDRVHEIDPSADCRMVEYGVHPNFYDLEWRPERERPYALFVGGSGYRKGFDLLVEALRRLPERKWELRVAGDSKLEEACSAAGLSRVKCLGLLSWSELHVQLQNAWCSVLPTRADTSPNSVKEARVVGLPVVTSAHGGQAGYIRDEENGFIVEPLGPLGLASALEKVMSSFETATAMGRCRHREDRAYLSPERTGEGFASIYRQLAIHTRL